jgi:hypothetical protein
MCGKLGHGVVQQIFKALEITPNAREVHSLWLLCGFVSMDQVCVNERADYLDGISVLWLATQSQTPSRLIQVSVKRERIT